ncbi:MAG TPA: 30S ribosomal protein S8e [Candidatus Nanoarchaeia archaeon]|nr:30S ribosomal protein S8e [Candidatus Nanoarchaeia archaeon]
MDTGRKITGGKYHANRKSRHYSKMNQERHATLGETKRKSLKVTGGNMKRIVLRTNEANILVKGKMQKVEITNVEKTPQNIFYARQNRLVKGAIISTSAGKARITNRPSQEGMVNAALIE